MPEQSTPNEYRTVDLIIATLLSYFDFELITINKITQDKYIFIFIDQEEKRQDIMMKFANRQMKVDPYKWEDIRRNLKSLLINY